jgi:membrane protein DedA with SNARE-associated domain
VFQSLVNHVSGSDWTYVFIFGIAALDAVFPLVPSETSVITAGVLAASGDLVLPLIILAAALGAFLGDMTSFTVGRFGGHWVQRKLFAGERRKRLDWAERMLQQRGGYLIVIARFIPGGRTAVTLTAGMLEMPWRKFIPFDLAAGFIWGIYAALVGYFGGKAFEQQPWKGLVLALAVAFGIAGAVEAARWYRRRQQPAA